MNHFLVAVLVAVVAQAASETIIEGGLGHSLGLGHNLHLGGHGLGLERDLDVVEDDYLVRDRKVVLDTPCHHNRRPEVMVHHQKRPIVVHGRPHHHTIFEEEPLVVKTPSAFMHKRGHVRVEPRVVKIRPSPLFLTQKTVKLVRPVHKKVFVEQFTKKEFPCKDEIIERKLTRPCHHDRVVDHIDITRNGGDIVEEDFISRRW